MLPAAHRMRVSSDFAAATRSGRRARCGALVLYLLPDTARSADVASVRKGEASVSGCRVGLIVGKVVGGSVVRHKVSRRLRAQLAERLEKLPAGSRLVVRALPEAARAGSKELGRDLDRALYRVTAS